MGRWAAYAAAAAVTFGCGREGEARAPAPPPPAKLEAKLAWATYWGAPGGSALRSAVFDVAGNLYIAGGTERAADWPRSAPPIGPLGDFDVIVAKFDPNGRNVWSLVIGGTGEDYAYVSALDPAGNLIVGGRGGPAFPVTPGAFSTRFAGGFKAGPHDATDGFLFSLTPDGALRWATYIGSAGDDIIRAIEVLPDGRIAVAGGMMESGDLPVTPGVLKPKLGGVKDAWVALVGPSGDRLDFLTYFGPSDDAQRRADETLRAVALATDGNLWLAGTTQGSDLSPTPDAFQPLRGGDASAFVAKLTPDGTALRYFSWLGGSGSDDVETEGSADPSGAFVIAGGTESADFPATRGASSQGGAADGWVARIEADGALGMAARFGGSGRDHFFGPAWDAAGNLYVGGTTDSRDLPVTAGALQSGFAGGASDALFAAFDRKGALAYATYFGGGAAEAGRFAAIDRARGRVALIGETTSTDLPLRDPAQAQPGAVFVAVFAIATPRAAAAAEPAPAQ
jgi:hypothetical protein